MAKGQRPDFNARVKVGNFWYDAGAAWKVKGDAISVRPIGEGWDGSVLLVVPKNESE